MVSTLAHTDRYARQTIFPAIGTEGQARLAGSRVLLVGCGALGSVVADLLVRAGIGHLTIADRDYVELSNLQRQSLFEEADVEAHTPKAAAAAERLRRVNGTVQIEPQVVDVNPTNLEALATGMTVIVDGTDNFEARYLINDVAVKLGLPWVYGGVIGSYGMTMTIQPGITPCLRCVFAESPEPGTAETCDTAGVLGPAVHLVASMQAAEALKLAIRDMGSLNRDLLALDVWTLAFNRVPLGAPTKDCPACQLGELTFLNREAPSQTTALCGHDAVQVLMHPPVPLDLAQLGDRLRSSGDVALSRFLLRFRPDTTHFELTVFPDGRAIVKGTTDPTAARVLYARWVGM